jgi:GNAT superfamily N-acetyltransferase
LPLIFPPSILFVRPLNSSDNIFGPEAAPAPLPAAEPALPAQWTAADFAVIEASELHTHLAETIVHEMAESAKARGTGIAKRSPDYVAMKMREGKAVVAIAPDGAWAGFCYIESWSHGEFVANSGLIVAPAYRKFGLATRIKQRIFALSRQLYPEAKIFGLTTGLAVMKINSDLGYEPVTYSELTQDEEFWKGCQSCVNFEILTSKQRKVCMCTAMLFDPVEAAEKEAERAQQQAAADAASAPSKGKKSDKGKQSGKWNWKDPRTFERFMRVKLIRLLRGVPKGAGGGGSAGSAAARSFRRFLFF